MATLSSIKRLYRTIDASVFCTTGRLDYDRVTDAVIKLANAVHDFPMSDDGYEIWDIGEFGACNLADFIAGAYWHYTEWHSGQWSKGYAALSALGQVFSPGMSSLDEDSPEFDAYFMLETMATP